jgi:phosphate:Na+ symporter
MAVMGVGMVFFGLELMKDACAQIEKMPAFEAWLHRFQADTYFGVLRCALVGCVLTMIVQSSSAMLGITISLAYQGVIDYPTAAALVLGENIGTTITAFLASLGATTNARRAAYFHILFNVLGVAWITSIFGVYIELIQWLVYGDVAQSVLEDGRLVYPHTTAAIAATHSGFNIANTILFLPIMRVLVRFLERFVPAKPVPEKTRLTELDVHMLETPVLAIEQSQNEILKMGRECEQMMTCLLTLREQDELDRELVRRVQQSEDDLDAMQDEVSHFITDLLAHHVPHGVAEEARGQLRMADEYESVSDYVASLLKFDSRLRKEELRFTEQQRKDLAQLHHDTAAYVAAVNAANRAHNRNIVAELKPANKKLRNEVKRLRQEHLVQLSSQTVPPAVSVAFMAALNSYTRIRDHALNIAEVIAGEK